MSTVGQVNVRVGLIDRLTENLRRSLNSAKNEIKKLRAELEATAKKSSAAWRNVGDELGKISGKAAMAGAALTIGLTGPILLAARSALDAAAKMEALQSSFTQVIGSSAGAAEQLKELRAMSDRTAQGYQALAKTSLVVTAGFDGDAKAANAVLERFARMSNVLNVTGADFDRLGVNLGQIAGASRLMGDELRETAAILPGLRGLLKEAFGTANTEDLAKMGITGRQALEGIAAAIEKSGMKANLKTYQSQLNILVNQFEDLKRAAGDALLPVAKDIIAIVGPALQKLAEIIKGMTPEQRKMAIAFTAVLAALGPLLTAFGALGAGISGFLSLGSTLGPLLSSIGALFTGGAGAAAGFGGAIAALSNPITWVIAAIAALAAAYATNFAGIRDQLNKLFGEMSAWVGQMVALVEGFIRENWDVIVVGWEYIVQNVGLALNTLVNVLSTAWQLISGIIEIAIRSVIGTIRVFTKLLKGDWRGAWNEIVKVSQGIGLTLVRVFTKIAADIVDIFANMIESVASGIEAFGKMLGANWKIDLSGVRSTSKWLRGLGDDAAETQKKIDGVTPSLKGAIGGGRAHWAPQTKPTSPLNAFNLPGGGGLPKEARGSSGSASAAKSEAKKIDERLTEITRLQRELAAARLEAAGATTRDVLATREYGKAYTAILDPVNKRIISLKAESKELEENLTIDRAFAQSKRELNKEIKLLSATTEAERRLIELRSSEAFSKLGPAQKMELELLTTISAKRSEEIEKLKSESEAKKSLTESIRGQIKELTRARELLTVSGEEALARYEVEKGAFKDASAWDKAAYIASVRALEQDKKRGEYLVKMREFWGNVTRAIKEQAKAETERSQSKYDEYVMNLTRRLQELSGASDELLRKDLSEQFRGLFPEVKDTGERARAIAKAVEDIIAKTAEVAAVEKAVEDSKKLITTLEDSFMSVFDKILNEGFSSFYSGVIGMTRSLVREMIGEFARLQFRRFVTGLIGQIGGAAAGEAVPSMVGGDSYNAAATGGLVHRGVPVIVGEAGRELFVPQENGQIVPNYQLGGAGAGGGSNITVNVVTSTPGAWRRDEAVMIGKTFARANARRKRDGRG